MKTKKSKTIGFSLLLIGIFIISYSLIPNYIEQVKEETSINYFFEVMSNEVKTIEQPPYNYIAVLEIPRISLKKGLFDINDRNNNVDRNIKILNNSDMPNINNGLLIIAAHSGRGRAAFFDKLDRLTKRDLVYIYYQNDKYTYEVSDILRQYKTGSIDIVRRNYTELILTTCDQVNKDKQIIVRLMLVGKLVY